MLFERENSLLFLVSNIVEQLRTVQIYVADIYIE